MMRLIRVIASRGLPLPLLVLGLSACDAFNAEPDIGIYRAVIDTPTGDLPFGLQIEGAPRAAGAGIAVYLLDGSERTSLQDISREDRRFGMFLPGGAGSLEFTARGRRLTGTVALVDSSGQEHEFDFSAETGVAYRFYSEPLTDNADITGRWSASISGATGAVWLDLTQSHDLVSGTYHEQSSLSRTVTGQVHGDALRLSSFKGRRAELWTADFTRAGTLEGSYWSSLAGKAAFSARRDPDTGIPGDLEGNPAEF